MDYDFIGFSFKGKHSIKNFNIYRTSDGTRYNDNLLPKINDKTAELAKRDGSYYFYSTHSPRQFSIPVAFDRLTELQYREMRQWLDGKDIGDLVFDEAPYKVYSAKATGTPQLKTICFTEGNNRIYKGEGTIQFTCYWPYAHTPVLFEMMGELNGMPPNKPVPIGVVLDYRQTFVSQIDAPVRLSYIEWDHNNNVWRDTVKKLNVAASSSASFSSSQMVMLESITLLSKTTDSNKRIFLLRESDGTVQTFTYQSDTFYPSGVDNRNINNYSILTYPNKKDWVKSSKLLVRNPTLENYGDVPAPFTARVYEERNAGAVIKIGNLYQITLEEKCSNITWDSSTGLVTGEVDGKVRPIAYKGKSYGTIPVGDNRGTVSSGVQLFYDFWYY